MAMTQLAAFEPYERALMTEQPVVALRDVVKGMLDSGRDRDAVLADLKALALDLRHEHRESDEDVVLDVTDYVTGWCSPHMAL